jgi:TonB family protein
MPRLHCSKERRGTFADEGVTTARALQLNGFAARVLARDDIFTITHERFLQHTETVCLSLALLTGLWLATREIVEIPPIYFDAAARPVGSITAVTDRTIEHPAMRQPSAGRKVDRPAVSDRPGRSRGRGEGGGGGSPTERVAREGVFAHLAGPVSGLALHGDPLSPGGYIDDIDALLDGTGALKHGGSEGTGRRGLSVVGFGEGYGPGFGNKGVADIDDLIGGPAPDRIVLRKRPTKPILRLAVASPITGRQIVGGRSRSEIVRVVMTNIAALRYAYNHRLREKPGLRGKVTIRFAVDELGKVLFCEVVQSTLHDPELENAVLARIRRWRFDRIDKPGDITEIVYPFVFSQ